MRMLAIIKINYLSRVLGVTHNACPMSNLSTTDQSQRILLLGRRDYYTFRGKTCLPIVLQKYGRMAAGALSIPSLSPRAPASQASVFMDMMVVVVVVLVYLWV